MPDEEEIQKWHRWFAVECNNLGWNLVAQPERSIAEDRGMLLAANTAAFHWSKIGQPINNARADLLLAHAHAMIGDGERARHFALRCLSYCEENPCEDWDCAFAHAGLALSAAVSGDTSLHAEHYAAARKLGAAIQDDEDRKIFHKEFARVPPSCSAKAAQ